VVEYLKFQKFAALLYFFGKVKVRLTGLEVPEGWLCARITPQAFAFRVAAKISFGSATVPVLDPVKTSQVPRTFGSVQ